MFKKVFSFALCGVMLVGLSACGSETSGGSVNTEYASAIKTAADKLESTYTDYIVTTTIEAPDGNTEFLEVKHEGDSYTEYSVGENDEIGSIAYGSAESITYSLTDWLTADGQYYLFGADATGAEVTYTLPKGYADYIGGRTTLYADKIVDTAKSIEKIDDLEIDLGSGIEAFTSYKVTIPAQTVKEILGVATWGVYDCISNDKDTSANVKNLVSNYLSDLDMNLTFSDANVIVGVDSDGILKYTCLETGGLGTRLYYTKAVVATKNTNIRTTPDFTGSVAYTSSLTDLADYVADFDSYEDAMNALENGETIPSTTESTESGASAEVEAEVSTEGTEEVDSAESTEEGESVSESTETE